MTKRRRRLLSALLLWALLLSLCGGAAFADESGIPAAAAPLDGAEDPSALPEGMWDVRVYVDGLLCGRALGSYEGTWLSPEDLCAILGVEVSNLWNDERSELSVGGHGFVLHAVQGQDYFSVNSRWIYDTSGFFIWDGRGWFTAESVARIFGGDLRVSDDGQRVDFSSETMAILPGGAAWYVDNFGPSDLFWLARIIHAEAGGQPLAGKIGVGNVVLNRVASARYPDTIEGVIFDQNFNVQFQPTLNGTIYEEPNEEDVICACLCLEGYNTVGESMFFVNPRRADDYWFRTTKELVISIGDHDFYRIPGGLP